MVFDFYFDGVTVKTGNRTSVFNSIMLEQEIITSWLESITQDSWLPALLSLPKEFVGFIEIVVFWVIGNAFLIQFSLMLVMLRCFQFCVRRRRTHTNRVVFTEITLAGFVDQCRGYRSWCHAISAFGRHFGLCGTYSLDLMCWCFLDAVSWNLHEQWNYRSRWKDRTHFY